MTASRYDVSAPLDYQDGQGETKTKWLNLGVAFPDRNGDGLTVLLSGTPVPTYNKEREEFQIKLRLAPPRDREENSRRTSPPRDEGLDQDIPF